MCDWMPGGRLTLLSSAASDLLYKRLANLQVRASSSHSTATPPQLIALCGCRDTLASGFEDVSHVRQPVARCQRSARQVEVASDLRQADFESLVRERLGEQLARLGPRG